MKEKISGATIIRCDHTDAIPGGSVRCSEYFVSYSASGLVEYQAQVAGWAALSPRRSGEHACVKHKVGKRLCHIKNPTEREP